MTARPALYYMVKESNHRKNRFGIGKRSFSETKKSSGRESRDLGAPKQKSQCLLRPRDKVPERNKYDTTVLLVSDSTAGSEEPSKAPRGNGFSINTMLYHDVNLPVAFWKKMDLA